MCKNSATGVSGTGTRRLTYTSFECLEFPVISIWTETDEQDSTYEKIRCCPTEIVKKKIKNAK